VKHKRESFIILTPGFPGNESETNCLPLQQAFVRDLHRQHPELDIIVLTLQYPYTEGTYNWNGITVKSFNGRNRGGIGKLLVRRKVFQELGKLHSANEIKGIFSFWLGECALVGNRFANRNNLLHRCWILGQDARKENKYVELVRPDPGELVALSDFIMEEFTMNHGIRPVHLGYPGVDPALFKSTRQARDIDLLASGSLIPLKRFEIFIETVQKVKDVIPCVKAVIAGDGPQKKKLEDLVTAAGVRENLHFTGQVEHHQLIRIMQRSKVFLHPSAYEGFGMVCLEALAAGAQVISFVQPLVNPPERWHYVQDPAEMKQKTLELLNQENPVPGNNIPFRISDTVHAIMNSFAYAELKA
jgi:glycosyltransferase involved in cell wall biosynthesis